jgi:toxin-antitoxin system PIN domain toxin
MFVIDTNVLLYAADASSPDHASNRRLLENASSGSTPWFLTWGIVYEFLRVATHPRVYARPRTAAEAHAFIDALMQSPTTRLLTPTERHANLLAATLSEVPDARGTLLHDLHTAALMREHGVSRIVTRNSDFLRFPFLTVVDPRRADG